MSKRSGVTWPVNLFYCLLFVLTIVCRKYPRQYWAYFGLCRRCPFLLWFVPVLCTQFYLQPFCGSLFEWQIGEEGSGLFSMHSDVDVSLWKLHYSRYILRAILYTRISTLITSRIILWVHALFQPTVYNIGGPRCRLQNFNWMENIVHLRDEIHFIPGRFGILN